jgi:hypothetical protein
MIGKRHTTIDENVKKYAIDSIAKYKKDYKRNTIPDRNGNYKTTSGSEYEKGWSDELAEVYNVNNKNSSIYKSAEEKTAQVFDYESIAETIIDEATGEEIPNPEFKIAWDKQRGLLIKESLERFQGSEKEQETLGKKSVKTTSNKTPGNRPTVDEVVDPSGLENTSETTYGDRAFGEFYQKMYTEESGKKWGLTNQLIYQVDGRSYSEEALEKAGIGTWDESVTKIPKGSIIDSKGNIREDGSKNLNEVKKSTTTKSKRASNVRGTKKTDITITERYVNGKLKKVPRRNIYGKLVLVEEKNGKLIATISTSDGNVEVEYNENIKKAFPKVERLYEEPAEEKSEESNTSLEPLTWY